VKNPGTAPATEGQEASPNALAHAGGSVSRISYHGWPDCWLIANGRIEAIVVPAIGRVMQLRLRGDPVGTFWENRTLDGRVHDEASREWLNLGGDKCWPAPQSAWPRLQGRDWPPPAAFDARPLEAVAVERGIVLTSEADPAYGIQIVRHVQLDAALPVMRIRTVFRKLAGEPVTVAIWSITQMQDPERVCMVLNAKSKFEGGFIRLMPGEPADLDVDGPLLTLTRNPRELVKIGADAGTVTWVGTACVVQMDAETGPGEYPDGGCVAEVYTNPDPLPYVELETLGPLEKLGTGSQMERTTTYTVMPR